MKRHRVSTRLYPEESDETDVSIRIWIVLCQLRSMSCQSRPAGKKVNATSSTKRLTSKAKCQSHNESLLLSIISHNLPFHLTSSLHGRPIFSSSAHAKPFSLAAARCPLLAPFNIPSPSRLQRIIHTLSHLMQAVSRHSSVNSTWRGPQ